MLLKKKHPWFWEFCSKQLSLMKLEQFPTIAFASHGASALHQCLCKDLRTKILCCWMVTPGFTLKAPLTKNIPWKNPFQSAAWLTIACASKMGIVNVSKWIYTFLIFLLWFDMCSLQNLDIHRYTCVRTRNIERRPPTVSGNIAEMMLLTLVVVSCFQHACEQPSKDSRKRICQTSR